MKTKKYLFITFIVCVLGLQHTLKAQAIPKNEYLKYLPLEYPRIIEQTQASIDLQLFGDKTDPDYRDANPIDGIDDHRHDMLMNVATRFAPFLIQNTISAPVDFKAYMKRLSSFPLYIDTWNIATPEPELISADSIDFSTIDQHDCQTDQHLSQSSGNDDCKLLALLNEFYPHDPQNERLSHLKQNPDREIFKMIYFDFPGEDPESWRKEFTRLFINGDDANHPDFLKNYVHPLIID